VSSGVYRDTLLRGLSSTALLLFGILLSLTVGAAAPGQAPRLAALATAALLWRGLFAAGSLGAALAGFASALDLAVGLGLTLVAVGLTGGLGSELYPLLLVDLALAHGFLGPAASRFLAVATLLGLGALATLAGPPDSAGAWLGVGLRLLWPLALLVAMELWSRAADGDAGERAAAPPAELSMSPPATPRAEASLQEILHDLRSPLTVIRLYAELLGEHARKGEPPVADHVQNLRAEIELMESLLDVDGESRAAVRSRRRRRERFDLVKLLGTLANIKRCHSQVVMEISEKEGIWDYATFREVLARLRSSGLQIAIDDAGSGYSGLESILQMRPEYIKVANSIVHSLHQETIKREIITALASLGRQIESNIVAEGIEHPDELRSLLELGVNYGQGYLLGRPRPRIGH
jgi:signal transduction histidine kinase